MDARAGAGIHAKDQIQLKKRLSQSLKGYDGNGYGLFLTVILKKGKQVLIINTCYPI